MDKTQKPVRDRNLMMFLVANALMGVITAVENTSFSSRLYDGLGFDILQRSMVEVPREMPGLLTALMIALLFKLDSTKIAGIACLLAGVGITLFGFIPSNFILVIATIVLFSTGIHLNIPVLGNISMSFAEGKSVGTQLGKVQGLNTLALIASCGLFYALYAFFKVPYYVVFSIGGVCGIIAGILYLRMKPIQKKLQKTRFIFKKKYSLYYVISVVNGARKQLTLTFVPWVILNVFNKGVTTVTFLYMTVSAINVIFRPLVGRLIDKWGEKKLLKCEAVVLLLVCLALASAKKLFPEDIAFVVACGCYIIDQLLMTATMARTTLAYHIVDDESEIPGTLAMGSSMDHVMSVVMPVVAGYVWYLNGSEGYVYVFLGGAVISLINLFLAARIKTGREHELVPGEQEAKQEVLIGK